MQHGDAATAAARLKDLDVAPADARGQPSAEGLEDRLLGGEAGGDVLRWMAPAAAVRQLPLGQNAGQADGLLGELGYAGDIDQVDAGADVDAGRSAPRRL